MKKISLATFAVGFIFSLGLGLSGMTQATKVIAFLDLFGKWDPSLIFVMLGAVIVHFGTYRVIRKRKSPLLSAEWHVPTKRDLTPALLVGSFLFGVGWGIAGFCPGPALTSLASFQLTPLIFVVSMFAGMQIFHLLDRKLKIKR